MVGVAVVVGVVVAVGRVRMTPTDLRAIIAAIFHAGQQTVPSKTPFTDSIMETNALLAALSTGDKSSPAPAPCPECGGDRTVPKGTFGKKDWRIVPCPSCQPSPKKSPTPEGPDGCDCEKCQPAPGGEPKDDSNNFRNMVIKLLGADPHTFNGDVPTLISDLRTQVAALTSERDALKAENAKLRERVAGLELELRKIDAHLDNTIYPTIVGSNFDWQRWHHRVKNLLLLAAAQGEGNYGR